MAWFKKQLHEKIKQQITPINRIGTEGTNGDSLDNSKRITCEEIDQVLGAGGKLIDVRNPAEFVGVKIFHARNIPLMHLHKHALVWKEESINVPILIYADSVWKASIAKDKLDKLGFKNVTNIGVPEWYSMCI